MRREVFLSGRRCGHRDSSNPDPKFTMTSLDVLIENVTRCVKPAIASPIKTVSPKELSA